MSPSDKILITIKDTANGLTTIVQDLTSGQTGSMVASGANGFTQTIESTHAPDPSATCNKSPFSYHPEYLTALPGNNGSWIFANINLSFEIGHGQVCGDAACTIKPDSDADDTGCGTILGVGVCGAGDSDLDGLSYVADWPDGTANHPSPLIIGNALDNGMGPLSFSNDSYQAAYKSIFFQPNGNAAKAAFFPFFSQAGTGRSCVFNFGDHIPGTTTDDLGKGTQYGTTIENPCTGAPIAVCQNITVPTDPNVCTASSASIDNGSFDSDGDALTLTRLPAAPYSLGTTSSVLLTVTDTENLSASCTANVTVVDQQPPTITCPLPVAECTGPSGAAVTFSATVSDNCPGVQNLGCTPPSGSTFPLGTTPFTCNAKDSSNNTNSCGSNVVVRDTTPPTISSVSATPNVLWSPDHKMVPVSIMVTATDTCDPSPTCKIVSVVSSEPVLGPGSGHTEPDWVLSDPGPKASPATLGVQLRAERAGGGNGRIYTVNVSCSDASSNTSVGQTTVAVPHDQGQ